MKYSILLVLLTAVFFLPAMAQELGVDVQALEVYAMSPREVQLSWASFEPADRGASVTYSIFRGTTETFVPSLKNRIATGLMTTSYMAAEPKTSRDYYYYVKAVVRSVSSQSQNAPCRALIAKLNGIAATFSPSPSNASGEQRLADMEQLEGWREQLGDCVINSPAQLTTKDWQNAVFLQSELTRKFDDESQASKAEEGQETLRVNVELFNADKQQWLSDYNDLAHKYNALVRDYNDQRDLIIRLVATPPALPPARTFVHCSTFNFGMVGSIDCY
jgi:hypothetical protein